MVNIPAIAYSQFPGIFYEQTTLITKWALPKDSYFKQRQCHGFAVTTISMIPGYFHKEQKENRTKGTF